MTMSFALNANIVIEYLLLKYSVLIVNVNIILQN